MNPWFDVQTANTIGGILGAVIGIWGGCVLGGMSWFYVKKGWKKLAYCLWGITVSGGFILLAIGVFALCAGQPRHVWWPFLLCGVITAAVLGGLFPMLRKRFAERERQIMEIHDL